jgi:hypothetical protein
MPEDRLQLQRFENKYLVREETALQIRELVRSYLELDENSVGKPNLAYPVHSLYLDSDQLRLHWETINGTKNRYKLRLRFYDDDPETPVFFEIKRRVNNCIMKQRGGVRRDAIRWLLAGHFPDPSHLLSKDPKQLVALQRFCQLMSEIHAKPKVHVAYLREAYVSTSDNSVRVTLDRQVRAEPDLNARLHTAMRQPVDVFDKDVILELKFTNRFPDWFGELVRIFNCMQCGAAKYVESASVIGEHRLGQEASLFAHAAGDTEFMKAFPAGP